MFKKVDLLINNEIFLCVASRYLCEPLRNRKLYIVTQRNAKKTKFRKDFFIQLLSNFYNAKMRFFYFVKALTGSIPKVVPS